MKKYIACYKIENTIRPCKDEDDLYIEDEDEFVCNIKIAEKWNYLTKKYKTLEIKPKLNDKGNKENE